MTPIHNTTTDIPSPMPSPVTPRPPLRLVMEMLSKDNTPLLSQMVPSVPLPTLLTQSTDSTPSLTVPLQLLPRLLLLQSPRSLPLPQLLMPSHTPSPPQLS